MTVCTLQNERFALRFSSDGKPAGFKVYASGKDLLNPSDPGQGFYLHNGERRTPLTDVFIDHEGKLLARSRNGTQEAVFSVQSFPRYVVFRMERLKGIPASGALHLHFELHAGSSVRAMELDYMTEVSHTDDALRVDWHYLWHRAEENPLGGFVLYDKEDDADEDETILHIWVEQALPHPKLAVEWTVERAKQWIAEWQNTFADRSQMILEGKSVGELYESARYAERAGIKEIYLFTNTWRNGRFWPEREINWHVNRNVFPGGEEDLRAYSDDLRTKGMRLNLHYVSGGIGFHDPLYVGSRPDRRLAAWGRGQLVGKVEETDTILLFKPDSGVELPYVTEQVRWSVFDRPPALPKFCKFDIVRIGNELIQVGSFEHTHGEVWTLNDCKRGMFATEAAAHAQGTDTVGLIAVYNHNFVPDNDSSLLRELAEAFAGFINRCGISHTEYDGAEIHCYNGSWGYRKFASIVYANLDHAVTAHDSRADVPACHIEYRLNSSRKLMAGNNKATHGNHSVPLFLSSKSRPAGTLLDAHFALSQGHAGGAMGIAKPEPMFGVSIGTLKAHGLTDSMTESLLHWKEVSKLLTEQDRRRIDVSFRMPEPKFERTYHPVADFVYRTSKEHGRYGLVPVHILRRRTGDIPWEQGQEHGPILPRQLIKPGERIELFNPNPEQPLQCIVRVLPSFDERKPTQDPATFRFHRGAAALDVVEANNANEDGLPGVDCHDNLRLQPAFADIRQQGDTMVTAHGGGLLLFTDNPRKEARWEADKLPWWDCTIDMRNHRGVGMTVSGDGSGAILLLHIPGRDYIVPVDFTGTRYIEIPHGEASWYDDRWGWRMKTKSIKYEHVKSIKLGFGYVPPETRATVEVRDIKALREIPAVLADPVIQVGQGSLSVRASVETNQILAYSGEGNAVVYDENWNKIKECPVEAMNYRMPEGWGEVEISAARADAQPWLEVQYITEGTRWRLPSGV